MSELKEMKQDYIVLFPDLTGKTVPAIAFKHIAEAADLLVAKGWTSLLTDGFALERKTVPDSSTVVVQVREAAEMLPKASVLEKLHEIGGCGADPDTYADGWDKAIDQAYEEVDAMEGVKA